MTLHIVKKLSKFSSQKIIFHLIYRVIGIFREL